MKKTLLLFLVIILPFLSFSQISEIVSEDWFLRSLKINDQTSYAPYTESFNIIFDEDGGQYTAGANGVENGLSATVVFDESDETLEFTTVSVTLLGCDIENCDYENLYFYEFLTDQDLATKSFNYLYTDFGDFKRLILFDENGNRAYYENTQIPQPDPRIFNTWYMSQIVPNHGGIYFIEDFNPPIQPIIEINPDFTFTGKFSCNTYSGTFAYGTGLYASLFITETFTNSNMNCQFHSFDENEYFTLLNSSSEIEFGVFEDSQTGMLRFGFGDINGGTFYNFQNTPLSISENFIDIISIYPNPVIEKLSIQNVESSATSYSVMDITGKMLKKGQISSHQIDVSRLQSGVYFLELVSEGRKAVKKFIKK